jgi:serine/threonine protein kinase
VRFKRKQHGINKQEQIQNFKREVEIMAYLNKNKFVYAPHIYLAWICGDMGYLLMERLFKMDYKIVSKHTLNNILKALNQKGYYHRDMHGGNWMLRPSAEYPRVEMTCVNSKYNLKSMGVPEVVLIDYGLAEKSKKAIRQYEKVEFEVDDEAAYDNAADKKKKNKPAPADEVSQFYIDYHKAKSAKRAK